MDTPTNLMMSNGSYSYIAVKASLYANDTAVFGLIELEKNALTKKFNNGDRKDIINGILLKAPPMTVVNALGQIGYEVISTTGETEVVWTMKRDV